MSDAKKGVVVAVVLIATIALLFLLRGVLTPVFFAFLLAYMLDPAADRCEQVMPRWLGILLILAAILTAVTAFLLLVVPGIVSDISVFFAELPSRVEQLIAAWEPYLSARGIPVPHSIDEVFSQVSANAEGVASRAVSPVASVVSWVVGGTASLVSALGRALLIPVIAFYLLLDFDTITETIHGLLPARFRDGIVSVAQEIDETLGQFVRGQVTVMLVLGSLYAIGYAFIGVRLAIPIGILAGMLAFIPYVGGGLGLGLALLMCAFDGSVASMGYVLVWFLVVQAFDGLLITPKIVGDKVGLSAVWVLLALMVGGEVFGFMGVLLAVPAAAVAKIFVVRGLANYRKSDLFGEAKSDLNALNEPSPAEVDPPALEASESAERSADEPSVPNEAKKSEAKKFDEVAGEEE